MKRILVFIACAIIVFSLVGCSNKSTKDETKEPAKNTAKIPNPFVDCKTLEEAQQIAGFDIVLPPSMPEGYAQTSIRAMKDSMIEIIYKNGDNEIRIRKAAGNKDISGDYNKYPETNTMNVDELDITLKGSDGKVNLATWTSSSDFSFAVLVNSGGVGMDKVPVIEMVKAVQ